MVLHGALALYQTSPVSLPYFETNGHFPNKLIFVAGLTDTIGVVPYLGRLAHALEKLEYSLVQPVKGSDLGGFGLSSLEGDAQELAAMVEHLLVRRENQATGKIVLMGHSTGCQDVVAFLSKDRSQFQNGEGKQLVVHGGILQAPVSDREYFTASSSSTPLRDSEKLIGEGKSDALLPRSDAVTKPRSIHGRGPGNADAVLKPAYTAYRFHSLNGKGGDDDYFSSDLTDDQIRSALQPALSRAPLLMLMGENDEYVPPSVDKVQLVKRWSDVLQSDPVHTMFIPCANHKVDDEGAQENVCEAVLYFLGTLPSS
ncbi:hypothetical protein MVES1_002986 [Malassezia vespertilionis]|uniref:uncharacterized protein n=1 Tax=Malassezia vespertilionis TaxID=2020962 RepID=UPI0024B0C8BA|nr:uncharacterized protein MVES1_002986 [Malassezia vespertilionis]WFD07618.1 hypothetical protein MVES1_002986 [Malassezia vespertilionis]